MALIGKLEAEVEIKSSAEKFFHIFRGQSHHIPNISPEAIQKIDVHEGDWETVGSVKEWAYTLEGGAPVALKETVEAVDDVNKTMTFNVIDGEVMKQYKNFKSILQAIEKEDGIGGLIKWTLVYEKISEDVPDPDSYLDLAIKVTKDIDEHHLKD